jgi:GWxTD domain-containing protein
MLGRLYRERGTINGRLESQQLLERGLQLFPRNPDVLVELGKTYFAQTFYPDAIRCFKAALEADPGRCEAHYYIGLYHYNNWKRVNDYTDNLAASRRHFAAAVQCDSSDVPSTIKLGYALYALERPGEAAELCEAGIARFPGIYNFYMLRGAIAYDDERFEDAKEYFDDGLSRMPVDLRLQYMDLFDLLSYEERFIYKESHESKREVIERSYWIDRDPDPTTALNERLQEHLYRMFIADLYFSCYRPPIRGWDTERGAAVVKFGWPWQITSTLGDSWDSGRIEKWYYMQRFKLRQFVFEDEYFSGNLRIPIRADSMVFVLRYEPRVSTYTPDLVPVPGVMDVTVFKNDGFSSSVYVCTKVDADSFLSVIDIDKINRFHTRSTFFNGDWIAERRDADTLWTGDAIVVRDGRKKFFEEVKELTIPFDSYHVAYAFEDQFGTAGAIIKGRCESLRFVQGDLCVSDVLFQRDPSGSGVSLVRRDKTLFPNTGRIYREGDRVSLYFEIYGLRVLRHKTDFEVTFSIYESPEEKPSRWRQIGGRIADVTGFGGARDPAISQTIHRQGDDYTSSEEMIINIDSLKEGRYELVVSVRDRISRRSSYNSSYFYKE